MLAALRELTKCLETMTAEMAALRTTARTQSRQIRELQAAVAVDRSDRGGVEPLSAIWPQ